MLVGGAMLLGCLTVIGGREKKRETEEERQKLVRGEKLEKIEMILGYIILLCRYIILMHYMVK